MSQRLQKANNKYFQIILIATLLMGSAVGINTNTQGVFLAPLANSLNSSITSISFSMTLYTLGTGLASFFVPYALNRFSYRQVITIMTTITCLATLFMAWTDQLVWISILGFLRGFTSAFFGGLAVQLLLNNWFFTKHGLITSIVFSASGLVGALASPLIGIHIEKTSVESALILTAILMLIMNLPGMLIKYQLHPEDEGQLAYGSESSTSIDKEKPQLNQNQATFSTFLIVLIIGTLATSVTIFVQHLPPLASNFNFSIELGSLLVSASLIANITSKLMIGSLADKKGAHFAIKILSLIVILGISLLLWHPNNLVMFLGAYAFGHIYGIVAVGTPLLIKQVYGLEAFAKVFPTVNFVSLVIASLFMSLYGLSFDMTGTYYLALWLCLGMMFLSIILISILNKNIQKS